MEYKIDISGMHCPGCKNLISMSLEEVGFKNVMVDSERSNAKFTSSKTEVEVQKDLKTVFDELTDYQYSNFSSTI